MKSKHLTCAPLRALSKINLHLGIYPRDLAPAPLRERGYHKVDSIMVPLALSNTIRVTFDNTEGIELDFYPQLEIHPHHTATYKAIQGLAQRLGKTARLRASIEGRIPSAAGVGSSSTDAATVLSALARHWGLDPLDQRVVDVAQQTGADVAFFLHPTTSYLSGTGDTLEETFPDLPETTVVLARPVGVELSAAQAYQVYDQQPCVPQSIEAMRAALLARDIEAVAAALYNNLAPAARKLSSEVARIESWLSQQSGVLGAMVSGSGSCSFALCENDTVAAHIVENAKNFANWETWITKTVGSDTNFC